MFTNSTWLDKSALSPIGQGALDILLKEHEIKDCMIVPIKRPDNQQLSLVVALLNKQDTTTLFDSNDHKAILQCFQYDCNYRIALISFINNHLLLVLLLQASFRDIGNCRGTRGGKTAAQTMPIAARYSEKSLF